MDAYLALDVGGTQIKSAVVADGQLYFARKDDAHSRESAEQILQNLSAIIQKQRFDTEQNGLTLAGVGLAFPGPFDYERGISRMRGIGKFDAIYGMELRSLLCDACGLSENQFAFMNDADLFCLGEAAFGEGKDFRRSMMICIGTGIGSGFVEDGMPVKSGPTVPENGWIYALPYRDGIVDQYLSASGIARMLQESGCFDPTITVKDAARLAHQGNKEAEKVFWEFGKRLEEVLPPLALRFGAECLVLGGQVAKSSDLFCHDLRKTLNRLGIAFRISEDSSASAMRAVPLLFT